MKERSATLVAAVVNLIRPYPVKKKKTHDVAREPEAPLTMTEIMKWVSRYLSSSTVTLPGVNKTDELKLALNVLSSRRSLRSCVLQRVLRGLIDGSRWKGLDVFHPLSRSSWLLTNRTKRTWSLVNRLSSMILQKIIFCINLIRSDRSHRKVSKVQLLNCPLSLDLSRISFKLDTSSSNLLDSLLDNSKNTILTKFQTNNLHYLLTALT